MISIEQLQEIIESSDSNKQKVAERLMQAINDWPTAVESVEAYLIQIKERLGIKEITKEALENILGTLNPSNSAWEIESITSFLEAFSVSETHEPISLLKFLS